MLKKLLCFFICCVITVGAFSVEASGAALSLSAASAVLMNVSTGEVVYEKNAYKERGIASTTKIMSALVALENGNLSDTTTAETEDVTVEGTSIGLEGGDKVSLDVLVKGMLLESGNDAANVTATLVAGGREEFVRLMNEKAKELGMNSTSFANPSGLTEEEHYSTAYDMALLGCAAVKNKTFLSICSAEKLRVSYGTPDTERTFYNHNKFLKKFDGALGIKTGYTKASGRCLVTAAQREGVMLVAVTLNAYDDWNDHIKLMEYGFERVRRIDVPFDASDIRIPVVGSDVKRVGAELSAPLFFSSSEEDYTYEISVYAESFVYAPLEKGDYVGWVEVKDGSGRVLTRTYLVSDRSAEGFSPQTEEVETSFFEKIIIKIKEGLSMRQT